MRRMLFFAAAVAALIALPALDDANARGRSGSGFRSFHSSGARVFRGGPAFRGGPVFRGRAFVGRPFIGYPYGYVRSSCWRWVATPIGPQRVWVCNYPYPYPY